MIKPDILENQARLIYLGIGSNLGNRKTNIERSKFELIRNNIEIIRISNYFESLSWPNTSNPKFLNIVIQINTNLQPLELLKICKNIEMCLGRKKRPKN